MSTIGMMYLATTDQLPGELMFYAVFLPVGIIVAMLVASFYGDDK